MGPQWGVRSRYEHEKSQPRTGRDWTGDRGSQFGADSCDPVNRLNECGRCGGLARSRVCRSVDSTDLVAHDEEQCNRQLRTVRDSR